MSICCYLGMMTHRNQNTNDNRDHLIGWLNRECGACNWPFLRAILGRGKTHSQRCRSLVLSGNSLRKHTSETCTKYKSWWSCTFYENQSQYFSEIPENSWIAHPPGGRFFLGQESISHSGGCGDSTPWRGFQRGVSGVFKREGGSSLPHSPRSHIRAGVESSRSIDGILPPSSQSWTWTLFMTWALEFKVLF